MTPTTFTPTETDLIFGNILKIPITDFTKGKGFEKIFEDLPNLDLRMVVEIFFYIYEHNICQSEDSENFNDQFYIAFNKLRNPQSDVEKIKDNF